MSREPVKSKIGTKTILVISTSLRFGIDTNIGYSQSPYTDVMHANKSRDLA